MPITEKAIEVLAKEEKLWELFPSYVEWKKAQAAKEQK